jgi:hypothetical protein
MLVDWHGSSHERRIFYISEEHRTEFAAVPAVFEAAVFSLCMIVCVSDCDLDVTAA